MPTNAALSLNCRAIQLADALETDAAHALFRQNYRAHPSLMTSVFRRICAHNSSASTFAAAGSIFRHWVMAFCSATTRAIRLTAACPSKRSGRFSSSSTKTGFSRRRRQRGLSRRTAIK